jgi:hypothetical protein
MEELAAADAAYDATRDADAADAAQLDLLLTYF